MKLKTLALSLLLGFAAFSALAESQYVVRIPAAIEAPAAEPAVPEISSHFLLAGNERAGAFSSALATKGGFIQAIGQNAKFDLMGLTLSGSDYSGALLPDGTFSFGTEDFTIDFWVYYVGPTNEEYSTYSFFFVGGGFGLAVGDSGYWNSMMLHIPGANTHIAYPNVNKASLKNKWNHIALVRSSGKIKLYVNGVGQDARNGGVGYNWGQLYPGNGEGVPREQSIDVSGARIGVHAASAILPLNASFRNFRVTKEALWSTDFTPPGAVEGGAPEIPRAPVSILLDNAALPRATTGVPYSFDLFERLSLSVDSYNDTDVTWKVTNPAAMPAGLNLSSAGMIHGTPTQTNYSANLDIEAAYKGSKVMRSFPINVNDRAPKSCMEILGKTPGVASGVYMIESDTHGEIPVYCDMVTSGGGWTLIGRYGNWVGEWIPTRNMVVRGDTMSGYSNDIVQYPAFKGVNVFNEIRFDSGDNTWNTFYGVSAHAGIRFPTKSAWPAVSSASDLIAGATRLDGSADAALSSISYLSAGWWSTNTARAVSGGMAFGLFTINNNSGACGGENRVGPTKMCPTTEQIGANNHFDISSIKYFYGR